ncbi:MAG: peptidyl-prolyl cis-trans isomerase, partial [Acetobacteraceae bacterium]
HLLQENGLTEQHFLSLIRQELGQKQVLDAVSAGATAPPDLTAALFAFNNETRTGAAVTLPFAAAPAPKPPGEAALKRWWANHPKAFSTPEYRKIRVAILSPDVLAKKEKVSIAALKAAYEQAKAEYTKPERRSAEIVLTPDQAKAAALAARWRTGASWAEMQEAAKSAGGTAIALQDALPVEFPDPALAKSIFSADPGKVTGPFQTPLGWHVIDVTGVVPGTNTTFADAKPKLEKKLAREQAANLIDSRVTGFEDAVAANPSLEAMPGDLGLVGVTGTLDKSGITPKREPAPIPGSAALRKAIVAAAFSAKKGDMASVVQGPDGSYYALDVDEIAPPHVQPYDLVKKQVLADWTAHQRRHEQNVMATHLMLAVNGGTPLTQAAAAAGLHAASLHPTRRDSPAAGVPAQLLDPLFQLPLHKATMVETKSGFVTTELMAVHDPSEKSDPIGYGLMQKKLARSVGADLQQSFVQALRTRAHPRVNVALLNKIAQP